MKFLHKFRILMSANIYQIKKLVLYVTNFREDMIEFKLD